MAGGNTTLTWNLIANSSGYVSGMKKASASTEALYKSTKKAQREQELMRKAAGLVGVTVALAFGKKIVNAASDMNETMSKTSVVFGKSAVKVQKWGESAAKSMGMSKQAALESAGTLGNLLLSMGNTSDAAADMSMTMVQLAADIGSFNNVSSEEVLLAMRSALTGEIAPMRRFGVNLTDLTIKAKAMELGLYDGKKAITVQAKSAASYALILEQTKTSQGDFARTADGLANSQKTLTATWEDAQAKLGENLVPTVTSAAQGLTSMLEVLNDLSPTSRNAVIGVAAVGTAAAVAVPRVLALNAALSASGKSLKGMVAAGGPYVVAASVIAGLGLSAHDSLDDLKEYDRLLEQLGTKAPGAAQIGEMQGRIESLKATLDDPGPLRFIRTGWEFILGIPNEADLTADQLVVAQRKYAQFQAAVSAVAWELKIPLAEAQDRVAKSGIDLSGTSAEVVARFKDYDRAAVAIANSTAAAADEWHTASGEAKSFKQALEDLNGGARDLTQSKAALVEKAKDLAKGLREGSTAFTLSTEKGRENLSNLIEVTSGIEDMGAAIFENNKAKLGEAGAREKATAAMEAEKQALIDNITKLTGSRKRAKELVDKYLEIPDAAGDAESAVKDLNTELGKVPKTKTIAFKITAQVSASAKAAGIDLRDAKRGATSGFYAGAGSPFGGKDGDPDTPYATGGYVRGPGTGTSDSIPARLSNGEFVMRKTAVDRFGPEFFSALNFAGGGLVDTGFRHKKRKAGSSSKARGSKARASVRRGSSVDWSIRDALMGDAAVDFDFAAYGNAVEQAASATRSLADADRAVFEARRRVNQAGAPAERAEAERDLADAYAAQAEAGKELAAADRAKAAAKPTGRNILGNFKARAAKLDRFRRDLKTLKSWGLSGAILQEILDSGIDDGGAMAAALVKDRSVIAGLNKTQALINADARALNGMFGGKSTGGAPGGGGSTGSSGTTGSSGSVTVGFSNAERPIVLKVDGEQVWKSLLHLKKAKGGASLGLS